MSKNARLDPRRSRKLTSRECSSIIGGYLGGMATSNLAGPEIAREAIGLFATGDMADNLWLSIRCQSQKGTNQTAMDIEKARQWQGEGDEAHRAFWRGLGAVISGCRVLASERAVKTACAWLFEQDGFWGRLD